MPSTADISPLSITDGKISNEARIAHAKLAKATEGQILVAQSNGKFAAKSLAGDVTLDAAGNTTSNVAVSADGTTVVTGATGAKGDTGSTGSQGATGATGAAGTDATVSAITVNAAGAIMHTDVPDSDTGFVKRTGAETYAVDTATYSTTGHTHDHNALTNYAVGQHRIIDDSGTSGTELWSANNINYHLGGKEPTISKNTAFNKNFGTASGDVCQGDDGRLSDTRTPSSTLTHKATHETGGADALSPADIGASASGHTHAYADITSKPSTFAPSSHDHAASEITSGTLHADRYTDTTYTADNGIALSGGAFSVAAGTGLSQDSSGLSLNLQGVAETAVDTGADYMVFLDGGATGAAKKESLADLVTKISGDGTSAADDEIRLTASSGILSLYASDLRSQSKIKYVKDITWETNVTGVSFSTTTTTTGDVSSAVCTITHNLNTKYVFVSVIEFSTTDTAHDPSHNNFVENLGDQIDMNYYLTAKPTNDNNIELYSNGSGIYAGSVFKVAIMG
tara:strand:+ start:762 stop:2297 length:1536 start_codon:yes stop_codon:yes gene_type:complete